MSRLVALRVAARLTQRQLASKVRRHESIIARIEMGERRVDVIEFAALCKALGADPVTVLGEVLQSLKARRKRT